MLLTWPQTMPLVSSACHGPQVHWKHAGHVWLACSWIPSLHFEGYEYTINEGHALEPNSNCEAHLLPSWRERPLQSS